MFSTVCSNASTHAPKHCMHAKTKTSHRGTNLPCGGALALSCARQAQKASVWVPRHCKRLACRAVDLSQCYCASCSRCIGTQPRHGTPRNRAKHLNKMNRAAELCDCSRDIGGHAGRCVHPKKSGPRQACRAAELWCHHLDGQLKNALARAP